MQISVGDWITMAVMASLIMAGLVMAYNLKQRSNKS